MMKLMAMYRRPDDVDAFMSYYTSTHMPLVEKIPGLQATVVNRVKGSATGGEPPYFLIAEMHFADAESFDAAMRSPENRATGKDLANFAEGLVDVLICET